MTKDQLEQLKQDALAIDAIRKRLEILSKLLLVQKLAVEAKKESATDEEMNHWDYARLAHPSMERASQCLGKAFRESLETFRMATLATLQGEIMTNPPPTPVSSPEVNRSARESK